MKICVVGSGYVGLVSAAVFADLGNEVESVDIDPQKIAMLNDGKMPIYEPGLAEMVARNAKDGRIRFSTDVADGIRKSDLIFICVGTPPQEDGSTDLSYVESVAKTIGENLLNGYKIVVNKSTVPVGTGDLVSRIVRESAHPDARFDVVSNPEFLREGQAIGDALHPDRVVIGVTTAEAATVMKELYEQLDCHVVVTDVASAEIIKYASNSFLATKISFANALADLCEKTGADIHDVVVGMGSDHRIGHDFLKAGLGFGGSCFPKDVLSLIHSCKMMKVDFGILDEVMAVNKTRAIRFVNRIETHFGGNLAGKTIALLGLAFKPETDDMRDAKSIEIIRLLADKGALVRGYDPEATETAKQAIDRPITYCSSAYEAAEGADALALVTEWREFMQLDLGRINESMNEAVLFDGRNLYHPDHTRKLGFTYYAIGRS